MMMMIIIVRSIRHHAHRAADPALLVVLQPIAKVRKEKIIINHTQTGHLPLGHTTPADPSLSVKEGETLHSNT
jgi:hypothetical protein